jgi:GNAT superfamily N-acetyltransferase
VARVVTSRASLEDLEAVAALFDAYRQFYGQSPDLPGARAFIEQRLKAGDSNIFVAEADGKAVGFAQLYPSFTSVGMAPIFVLNDLFVTPGARGTGAGRALLDVAAQFGRETGAVRLSLTTQTTNARAQSVYEANGWLRDNEFYTYNLRLTA